ncbi:MAG: hypothetical protein J6S14_14860 [Clostridia bacterium]|nr:hypothetical protein [Clostridia bacterium]
MLKWIKKGEMVISKEDLDDRLKEMYKKGYADAAKRAQIARKKTDGQKTKDGKKLKFT